MKLMTKELEKKFEKFPIYSQDGKGFDAEIVVKYFGGSSCTWLITEGHKLEDGDWELFGYCSLGWEYEWGYVRLSQIAELKFPPFGLPAERDLYCEGKTIREVL